MEALRETIFNDTLDSDRNSCRDQQYQRSNMQRSAIMNKLRQAGCRITKQRKSYWTSFYRRNAPVVRRFIFWQPGKIRILEWLQFTG